MGTLWGKVLYLREDMKIFRGKIFPGECPRTRTVLDFNTTKHYTLNNERTNDCNLCFVNLIETLI